jgi:putative hydrolase of the HAD superfamily
MLIGKVSTVIFDLDRTLWDFDKNSREVLSELLQPAAKKAGKPILALVHVYEHYNFLLWARYQKNEINRDQLRIMRFDSVLKHFGVWTENVSANLAEAYVERCPKKTALVNGTIDLLEYLKPKYNLHILSNGFAPVQHIKLKNSGLRDYFNLVVCPDTVGCKKPCKKIFHYTVGRAKIKDLSTAVYIGDEFSTDYVGATKAGLQAIHFDVHATHQTRNRVGRLEELKKVL